MDGEVGIHCTGFGVKLCKDDANGAFGLVEGFPGFAPVMSGGRGREAKAGMWVVSVRADIVRTSIVGKDVSVKRNENGTLDQHAPQGDKPF